MDIRILPLTLPRCPPAGYIPKLRAKLPLPATIHTFGFGYHLRSGLLKSIAEIGSGNYAFIPDAGMIGTVFVHAVANLQNTFATDATLRLAYGPQTQMVAAMGASVLADGTRPVGDVPAAEQQPFPEATADTGLRLTIPLGNIQYGQSRDVLLHFDSTDPKSVRGVDWSQPPLVEATITYKPVLGNEAGKYASATITHNLHEASSLPEETIAYHESRAQICEFLSKLFPIDHLGEHITHKMPRETVAESLTDLIENLPARLHADPRNQSLMQDLAGELPHGQISLALSDGTGFFHRWGRHYLPSLLNAHTRQVCNSFKDPGPLQYGTDAPLFAACRDRLDEAFDNLPPPAPSREKYLAARHTQSGATSPYVSAGPVSMASYRNSSGVCFAGSTLVRLASGRDVEIRRLRRGMKLQTPVGARKVAAVLRTPVKDETLCRVGGSVLVTPWHPVSLDGKAWTFPAYTAESAVRYTGSIYSIMLQRDRNNDAHALRLDGGVWGVTLGHGVTAGSGDARAHVFFGDYNAVGKSLLGLTVGLRGEFIGNGVGRDSHNGLVCTFIKDESRGRAVTWAPGARGKTILRS